MKKILSFLLMLCLTTTLFAQWTGNVNLNTTVRDSVGNEEATPLQATRNDGSTYISWFEQSSSGYQMRMQLLDKFGVAQWAPGGVVVSSFPQSTALYRYDMAVDKAGDAIVAFQDTRTGGALNVVAYKVDASGNLLWGSGGIQLIDPVSAEGLSPNIGITGLNNVIIAWTADNGSAKWIAMQKITSAGTTAWSSVHRVIDSTFVKKYSRPTMVAIDNDDFVMLYCEETGSGFPPTSKMFAQHYSSTGTAVWTLPTAVSTKAIPFFFFPKAVSDGSGGFYVAFNAGMTSNPAQTDVWVQHVNASGIAWNTTGNVACTLTSSQHFVANSRYDAANAAFWVLMQITDVSQGSSGVYVQKLDALGNVQLTANGLLLQPVSANYYLPRDLAVTPDGIITVYSIGSNSLSETLAAMKNSLTVVLSWSGSPVPISTLAAGKDKLSVGLFLFNQVVIVWSDGRNDNGIYAQNINTDGQVGVFTSVAESPIGSTLAVYPNPSSGCITIQGSTNNETLEAEVCNSLGQIVLKKDLGSIPYALIDLTQQPKGLYFVKLSTAGRVEVKKVIIE